MSPEEKKPVPPPIVEETWDNDGDEGDRPTMSIPAAVLAEIYARPPSQPPPASAPVPTNGMERMLITDAMLGKPPKLSTKTVKMTPLKPRK